MRYDHVIFDNDGVLLDSTTKNLQWMEKFRIKEAEKRGVEMTQEQSTRIFRASSPEEIRQVAKDTGLTVEQLREIETAKTHKKMEKIKKGEIKLFDSVKKVLKKIKQPKAMVSNAPQEATKFSLERYAIEKHFHTIRSPSLNDIEKYTEKKKPNPEMIEKVIKEKASENPIYIGDSGTDIEAAQKAGIDSIHVETSGSTERNPTYTVKNIEGILDIIH